MRIKLSKLPKRNTLNEGIFNRFIDNLMDAYKKGIEDQYIEKSRKANPELAKVLDDTIDDLDRLDKILKDIMKSQK